MLLYILRAHKIEIGNSLLNSCILLEVNSSFQVANGKVAVLDDNVWYHVHNLGASGVEKKCNTTAYNTVEGMSLIIKVEHSLIQTYIGFYFWRE